MIKTKNLTRLNKLISQGKANIGNLWLNKSRKKRCAVNQKPNFLGNTELTNKLEIKAMKPYQLEKLIEEREKATN